MHTTCTAILRSTCFQGTDPIYGTLPGLDLGVRGMKVGGQRLLIVPPELVSDP